MAGIPVNFATEATKASGAAPFYTPAAETLSYTQAVFGPGTDSVVLPWPIAGQAASPRANVALTVQGAAPDATATSFSIEFDPTRTQIAIHANAQATATTYVNVIVLIP